MIKALATILFVINMLLLFTNALCNNPTGMAWNVIGGTAAVIVMVKN
jgi:hypothetical protein